MFNNHRRDFDDDPFFSDPFCAHREHMRQMMRSFSEPHGVPFMPSLTEGGMTRHPGSSQALRDDHRNKEGEMKEGKESKESKIREDEDMSRSLMPFGSTDSTDMMRNPFGVFDSMVANMRNRMDEINKSFDNVSSDSNTHSFSSSSITTYSKVGNEAPKVFQASSSTHRAPGGVKETRRAVKDSESGVQKMSIGHHIQDRGHVVEKRFNNKTGEREFNQDFQNMDESEAQSFDQEWQQMVSTFKPSGFMSRLQEPTPRSVHQAALADPEQTHRDQRKPKAEGKPHVRIASSSKQ